MGSKGSNTTTQTYQANPAVAGAATQAISMAQGAASSPFQAPVQPIAGFTPDQLQAFQQYRDVQGMAQPYYDQAGNYINQSAQAITGDQVNNYLNPYSNYVLANLKESQGQQMNDLTGRVTQQAGGVGADRIGVAQGELARQQNLATGQTMSGIYNNALAAAQQDKARQANAGYAYGNLGTSAQNAALQGTQFLNQSGNQQQGQQQNVLNAQYQNDMARIAYPFQTAQYLAGISGGLGSTLGGTSQTTQPSPSLLSQILGGVTGATGMVGATGGFGSNGWANPSNWGGGNSVGSYGQNFNATGYGAGTGGVSFPVFANGGSVQNKGPIGAADWMDDASFVPTGEVHGTSGMQNLPKSSPSSGGSGGGVGDIVSTAMKILPMFLKDGGPVPRFADGGMFGPGIFNSAPDAKEDKNDFEKATSLGLIGMLPGIMEGKMGLAGMLAGAFGKADGGAVPPFANMEAFADGGMSFDDRFNGDTTNPLGNAFMADGRGTFNPMASPAAQPAIAPEPQSDITEGPGSPSDPIRMADADAVDEWRRNNPVPDPTENDQNSTPAFSQPAQFNPQPASLAPPMQNAGQPTGANSDMYSRLSDKLPYPDNDMANDTSRQFAKSPWLALANAGFAMMAGTSPFAGVNIGKGLQEGVKTLEKQREALGTEEGINLRAKQLMQQARNHADQYNRMTPYQSAQIENQRLVNQRTIAALNMKGWKMVSENPVTGEKTWAQDGTNNIRILKGDGTITTGSMDDPNSFRTTRVNGDNVSTKETPKAEQPPPPLNTPELASNLVPNYEVNTRIYRKGSPALAQASEELKNTTKLMGKVTANAAEVQAMLDQLRAGAGVILKDEDKDSFFTKLATLPGNNPTEKAAYAAKINGLAMAAGKPPPIDPKKVAAMEQISKSQIKLGQLFASQISPREAWAGQQMSIAATPGLTQSRQGMLKMIASFDMLHQIGLDKRQFFNNVVQKYGVAPNWEAEFTKQNPNDRYMVRFNIENLPNRRAVEELPKAVDLLRKNRDNPEVVKKFNDIYDNTASYWLTGKLDALGAQ